MAALNEFLYLNLTHYKTRLIRCTFACPTLTTYTPTTIKLLGFYIIVVSTTPRLRLTNKSSRFTLASAQFFVGFHEF